MLPVSPGVRKTVKPICECSQVGFLYVALVRQHPRLLHKKCFSMSQYFTPYNTSRRDVQKCVLSFPLVNSPTNLEFVLLQFVRCSLVLAIYMNNKCCIVINFPSQNSSSNCRRGFFVWFAPNGN